MTEVVPLTYNDVARMPISNALYGRDHPFFRPAYREQENREHLTSIARMLPEQTAKRLRNWMKAMNKRALVNGA